MAAIVSRLAGHGDCQRGDPGRADAPDPAGTDLLGGAVPVRSPGIAASRGGPFAGGGRAGGRAVGSDAGARLGAVRVAGQRGSRLDDDPRCARSLPEHPRNPRTYGGGAGGVVDAGGGIDPSLGGPLGGRGAGGVPDDRRRGGDGLPGPAHLQRRRRDVLAADASLRHPADLPADGGVARTDRHRPGDPGGAVEPLCGALAGAAGGDGVAGGLRGGVVGADVAALAGPDDELLAELADVAGVDPDGLGVVAAGGDAAVDQAGLAGTGTRLAEQPGFPGAAESAVGRFGADGDGIGAGAGAAGVVACIRGRAGRPPGGAADDVEHGGGGVGAVDPDRGGTGAGR